MTSRHLLILALLTLTQEAQAAWKSQGVEGLGAECTSYARVVEGTREGGVRCHFSAGALSTYPYPLTLHVPDHFVAEDELNLVLYFHGLSDHTKALPYDYVDSLFVDDMGIALARSTSNTILVMPGGTRGNAAFKAHLTSSAERFDAFMRELTGLAQRGGLSRGGELGRFVVAGHSGAHRPMRQLLSVRCPKAPCYRDQIDDLFLLDASYVMEGEEGLPFANFARSPHKRLHVAFRGGTVIADQSRVLYNHIHGTKLKDNAAFCRAHKSDLRGPLPCQFTCVTHSTLKALDHYKRGPSLHYKMVPMLLWRLLDAPCQRGPLKAPRAGP